MNSSLSNGAHIEYVHMCTLGAHIEFGSILDEWFLLFIDYTHKAYNKK